jgi:hypothetical protein
MMKKLFPLLTISVLTCASSFAQPSAHKHHKHQKHHKHAKKHDNGKKDEDKEMKK